MNIYNPNQTLFIILKKIKSNGHLYGFDQDAVAIETARARLSKISPRFTLIHTNFRNMKGELNNYKNETTNSSTNFGILTVKGRGIFNENRIFISWPRFSNNWNGKRYLREI